jgi:hypothetical protein
MEKLKVKKSGIWPPNLRMFVSGVNDTGEKREKLSGIIFFIFCEELS